MNKRRQAKNAYQELVTNYGVPFAKIINEASGSTPPQETEEVVNNSITSEIKNKISGFFSGIFDYSFGGVSFGVSGGSIHVQVYSHKKGWIELGSFALGTTVSQARDILFGNLDALVASGDISPEQARYLKPFIIMALVEMAAQGLLVDDIGIIEYQEKIKEFVKGVIIDESLTEEVPE